MARKATRQPTVVEMPSWGVFVFESRHAPDFRMPVTRHEPLEVFYLLDGAGGFELAGNVERCAAGDVVVVPSNLPHRISDDLARPLCSLPRMRGRVRVGARSGAAIGAARPSRQPAGGAERKEALPEPGQQRDPVSQV